MSDSESDKDVKVKQEVKEDSEDDESEVERTTTSSSKKKRVIDSDDDDDDDDDEPIVRKKTNKRKNVLDDDNSDEDEPHNSDRGDSDDDRPIAKNPFDDDSDDDNSNNEDEEEEKPKVKAEPKDDDSDEDNENNKSAVSDKSDDDDDDSESSKRKADDAFDVVDDSDLDEKFEDDDDKGDVEATYSGDDLSGDNKSDNPDLSDGDQGDDDYDSPSRKKKSKSKKERVRKEKKPKQSRKKAKVDDEGSGGDEGPAEESMEGKSLYEKAMMMEKAKRKAKSKGSMKGEDLNTNMNDKIREFVEEMENAALSDRTANESGKPAIEKLQMLDAAVSWLKKKDMHVTLIDNRMLSAMREWLTPLPDKSLPSLLIRTQFIQALEQMEIEIDSLKESGIGKIIRLLSQHPKETPLNRKKAKRLMEEWLRPLFKIKDSYKVAQDELMDLREQEKRSYGKIKKKVVDYDKFSGRVSKKSLAESLEGYKRELKPGDVGYMKKARMPSKVSMDYYVSPKSVDTGSIEKKKKDPRLMRFKNFQRGMKKQ